jgi:hypothetical protein
MPILDERESDKMKAEAKKRGWKPPERITFHHHSDDDDDKARWTLITRGDIDCGDFVEADVTGEIGTVWDCTNFQHKITQLHKMSWTRKKCALFIRDIINSYFAATRGHGLKPEFVYHAMHSLQVTAYKMNIPVFYTYDIPDTFNRIEYYIENVDVMPKPIDTFYLYRGDLNVINDIRMVAVIDGIGVDRAREFVRLAGGVAPLIRDAWNMTNEFFALNYEHGNGLGPVVCDIAWQQLQLDVGIMEGVMEA